MGKLFGLQFGVVAVIMIISGIIGGICWPYTINNWLEFAGVAKSIGFGAGFLLGLIPAIGQFSIPAAIITWVAMLIV